MRLIRSSTRLKWILLGALSCGVAAQAPRNILELEFTPVLCDQVRSSVASSINNSGGIIGTCPSGQTFYQVKREHSDH